MGVSWVEIRRMIAVKREFADQHDKKSSLQQNCNKIATARRKKINTFAHPGWEV